MLSNTKLKTTRLQKGLTQKQVAQKAKISVRRYQDYEAGNYAKGIHVSILIAKALNSTVEELFSDILPKNNN